MDQKDCLMTHSQESAHASNPGHKGSGCCKSGGEGHHKAKKESGSCCGGAAKKNAHACCADDETAKAEASDGCGCG